MSDVLVVGDIISDVYERYQFRKFCPDAPSVPAMVLRSSEVRPGGAANVAVNLSALSPKTRVTLIGEADSELCRKIKFMTKNVVDMSYIQMIDETLLTKRRIYNGNDMIIRLDLADRVSGYTQQLVYHQLKEYLTQNDPDLILLSDYGHGTIGLDSINLLLRHREKLMVDTKLTDLSLFEGTLLCKLNQLEWDAVQQQEAAPERFFKYLVVTLGKNGALLHARRSIDETHSVTDRMYFAPHKVDVVDVCGCGDTFLAGLASSILRNADPFTAVQFANAAAATVVVKSGTAVADVDEAFRLSGLVESKHEVG